MKILVAISFLVFVVVDVIYRASAAEITLFKSDFAAIANAKKCRDTCESIINTGIAAFRGMADGVMKVYVLPDVAPFSNCRAYGVPKVVLSNYDCKSDGKVYDSAYDGTWQNMTIKCDVQLDKNPANVAAALSKKPDTRSPCGDKIPAVNTVPYAQVSCPADAGTTETAGTTTTTVKMTAHLGRLTTRALLRGDGNRGNYYPLQLTAVVSDNPTPAALAFGITSGSSDRTAGYENSVACMKANQQNIQRRLLTAFVDTMYPCVGGADATFPLLKQLAVYVLMCVGLPPVQ